MKALVIIGFLSFYSAISYGGEPLPARVLRAEIEVELYSPYETSKLLVDTAPIKGSKDRRISSMLLKTSVGNIVVPERAFNDFINAEAFTVLKGEEKGEVLILFGGKHVPSKVPTSVWVRIINSKVDSRLILGHEWEKF